MPISQTNQLFSLIKSLTKSEKRNFSIYVNRIADSNSTKYIQLFDILDKQKKLEEKEIFDKIKAVNKSKYSNLKRHLYSQIMASLEQFYKPSRVDLQIRELLNFAQILYGKGLYLQSLKILQMAKIKAERHHYDLHYLSILEFEKKIESRHITRTGADKALELTVISEERNRQMSNAIDLSNLRMLMHNLYIKQGHVKNEQEAEQMTELFSEKMPSYKLEKLGVKEKAYLYQSFVWYYFILLDFFNCYIHALNWVNLFKKEPQMANRDPDLFMRGYHYLLVSAYNNKDIENYNIYLAEVERYRKDNYKKFNNNSQIMSFLYVHNGRLNKYFLSGDFQQGLTVIPKTLRRINMYGSKIDMHRIMVFYYKIAWMYLGAGKPDISLDYLQKIINLDVENLRPDIQGYSRLLFLMAHYDMGNEDIMGYMVQNTKSFFSRTKSSNSLQRLCVQFFQKVVKVGISDRKALFIEFQKELQRLQSNRYESRAFLYLDIPAWVRAKITKQSLGAVIKKENRQ